ncbi:MAG: (2Fe-2S) ferredoxin domain-containing protein [Defluviitaleaceae bacterium]|nr:(2Fe-2S) ferredoxin domain-containing protein [Defluviitaleaceae bacterium]
MISSQRFENAKVKSFTRLVNIQTQHPNYEHYILVCQSGKCNNGENVPSVLEELKKQLEEKNLIDKVFFSAVPCLGICSDAVNIYVYPTSKSNTGTIYSTVNPNDITTILQEHIENGNIVEELLTKIVD